MSHFIVQQVEMKKMGHYFFKKEWILKEKYRSKICSELKISLFSFLYVHKHKSWCGELV